MQVPDSNEPVSEQLRKASAMCLDILSECFEDLAVEVLRVIPAMVQSDSPWQHRYFFSSPITSTFGSLRHLPHAPTREPPRTAHCARTTSHGRECGVFLMGIVAESMYNSRKPSSSEQLLRLFSAAAIPSLAAPQVCTSSPHAIYRHRQRDRPNSCTE